jgi:hypothetical protein
MDFSLSHHGSPQEEPKKPRPPPVRGFSIFPLLCPGISDINLLGYGERTVLSILASSVNLRDEV